MQRDYTLSSLQSMSKEELAEFSMRMLHRLVPEEAMTELFTFEQEEVEDEQRMQSAQLDAMLRLNAIALSEIQLAFSESDNAQQNIERMTRLILWHFYAISFNLEKVIPLETHCEQVELIVQDAPKDAFGWVKALTELLHYYAEIGSD